MKRFLSAFLIVCLLIPLIAFSGCAKEEKASYLTPQNTEELFRFDDNAKTLVRQDVRRKIEVISENGGEEDTQSGYTTRVTPATETVFKLAQENDQYEMYFNEAILEFALRSKATGEVWFSNPAPGAREEGLRNEMSSQLSIFYINKTSGGQARLESYLDCVMNENPDLGLHQFYIVNHEGHLRVIYILGQVKPDYLFPTAMTEEMAMEYAAAFKSAEGYRMAASFITSGSVYTKIMPDLWNQFGEERRSELREIVPDIDEYIKRGETVFVIGDKTTWNKTQVMLNLQEAFVNVLGMDKEKRDEINEEFGIPETPSKTFWIPVDYILTENGLRVSVPSDEIQYDSTEFALISINLLQYFGSASEQDEGYIFVPDGSGAIINFNNGKTNIGDAVRLQLYGLDDGREKAVKPYLNQPASLPVFGIKNGNSALFAVIESGDTNATIIADIAGKSIENNAYTDASGAHIQQYVKDRNRCYAQFRLTEYEEMTFATSSKTSRIYQNEINSADLTIHYTILSEDKADYNGMAEYYRDYLVQKGVLKKTDIQSIPFHLELVGAYAHNTAFLGVPYTEMRALTTFEQAREILEKLSEAGIKNVAVNYRAWANDGLMNSVYNKINVLGALGGKNALQELNEYAESLGIRIYYETEMGLVYKDKMFDGYSELTDASRLVTRDIAYHNQYYVNWNIINGGQRATIVSPSKIYNIFAENNKGSNAVKVMNDLEKLKIQNVSLGSLSTNLPGNYKLKDFYDREKTAQTYAAVAELFGEKLGVMTKGANSYMLAYTDSIFEISNTSSRFNLADLSIPFYQMVIHGYLPYSGEPINLNGDARKTFLEAVEAASGLYYRWCYVPNDEVKDLLFDGMYSLNYNSWIDQAIAYYKEYNDLLASTAGETIVKHEVLDENVNRVTYSDGTTVIINYRAEDYITSDGTRVAKLSFAKGGSNA
ncbi:MAG: hypothetical protein J6X30_02855 [Clostridia bacterium]|nr:hypothetical protein [Clostridia bacterium]